MHLQVRNRRLRGRLPWALPLLFLFPLGCSGISLRRGVSPVRPVEGNATVHKETMDARSADQDEAVQAKEGRKEGPSLLVEPLLYLIHRHREEWTHYDGDRCPLYPTCSAWGEDAIRREPLVGLLLLVDRLFYRETGELHLKYVHTPRRLSRHLRYYDPLEDSLPLLKENRPSLYREEFPD